MRKEDVCCSRMSDMLQARGEHDPFADPDVLVHYDPKFDEYGLVIHDGGSSTVGIEYCPWCGRRLPESRRDAWYDRLEAMGLDPADEDEVPDEYKSATWYTKS